MQLPIEIRKCEVRRLQRGGLRALIRTHSKIPRGMRGIVGHWLAQQAGKASQVEPRLAGLMAQEFRLP